MSTSHSYLPWLSIERGKNTGLQVFMEEFWLHTFPAASQKLGFKLPYTWELMWHIVSSPPEASMGVWEHACMGTSCVFPSLFSPAIEQTFPIFPWNDFVHSCSIPTTATREIDSHITSYLCSSYMRLTKNKEEVLYGNTNSWRLFSLVQYRMNEESYPAPSFSLIEARLLSNIQTFPAAAWR